MGITRFKKKKKKKKKKREREKDSKKARIELKQASKQLRVDRTMTSALRTPSLFDAEKARVPSWGKRMEQCFYYTME